MNTNPSDVLPTAAAATTTAAAASSSASAEKKKARRVRRARESSTFGVTTAHLRNALHNIADEELRRVPEKKSSGPGTGTGDSEHHHAKNKPRVSVSIKALRMLKKHIERQLATLIDHAKVRAIRYAEDAPGRKRLVRGTGTSDVVITLNGADLVSALRDHTRRRFGVFDA